MESSLIMLLAALIISPVRGVTAQRDPQKLQQLDAARAALRNTPNDVRLQKRYLDALSDTYMSFMDLFENFDGFDYIDVLPSLAKNYDVQVGELLVRLGKDAHYEADSLGALQQATATYAGEHTKVFISLLEQLPTEKQAQLIRFLADVENHHAYPEYQTIVEHIRGFRKYDLARRFEIAREQRMKQPH
jgi:hypothetical protein